jgi:hypothetical protein
MKYLAAMAVCIFVFQSTEADGGVSEAVAVYRVQALYFHHLICKRCVR